MMDYIQVKDIMFKYDDEPVLSDVSFHISEGEFVSLTGENGAAKSTLLKIITGVLNPTKGEIVTEGKVAALLELGAGFDKNYTGRENIFLYGATMGYPRKFLEEKYDEIVADKNFKAFVKENISIPRTDNLAEMLSAQIALVEKDIKISYNKVLAKSEVEIKMAYLTEDSRICKTQTRLPLVGFIDTLEMVTLRSPPSPVSVLMSEFSNSLDVMITPS